MGHLDTRVAPHLINMRDYVVYIKLDVYAAQVLSLFHKLD
jgi:hypothetical protein